MMASYLDRPSTTRRDLETRFDTAVDPLGDLIGLHCPVRCESKDLLLVLSNSFLYGQALTGFWVDNKTVMFYALPHRRPASHDDQVGVLEPARHPVQIVEPRRDPDDPLPALHLQRDPLHRRAQQVVQAHQLALVTIVGDAEHE